MVTAQVIPVGVFGPLVGRLGDIYGRRYFVMAGNMFGLIGCDWWWDLIGVASACQQLAWSGLGEMAPENTDRLLWGFSNCAVRRQVHSVLSWVSRARSSP
jgi:MFS family permease